MNSILKKSLSCIMVFCLMFLCLGLSVKVNATPSTVTYTISSKTEVTVSGTAPINSSAIYSTTYTKVNQLTKDNSMTLTLTGFEGYMVTGITLSMKSNTSSGKGTFSATAGSNVISEISESTFKAGWYGSYSTEYVNVSPAVNQPYYGIQNGESIVIKIAATANSLYCQSFTLQYEEAPKTIKLDAPDATFEGNTIKWKDVDNASSYSIGIFNDENSVTPYESIISVEDSNEYILNYTPQGTYYVKVQANSNDSSYTSSNWSLAKIIENNVYDTKTIAELKNDIELDSTKGKTYYEVSGRVYSIEDEVKGQMHITDGENELNIYGLTNSTEEKIYIDDIITVRGYVIDYYGEKQLSGSYFISKEYNPCIEFSNLYTKASLNVNYNKNTIYRDELEIESIEHIFANDGLTNEQSVTSLSDECIIFEFDPGTNIQNPSKYYDENNVVRFYKNNILTIKSDEFIKTISFEFVGNSYSLISPIVVGGSYNNALIEVADNT